MRQSKLPLVPFTASQGLELGISRQMLRQLVADGSCRRVLRGVFQRADVPDTVENRARAAALLLPPSATFCDRTAAWLHGVDAFMYRELEILPSLDIVVLRDFNRLRRTGIAGGTRDLDPLDVTTVGEVRVTTPLRTALDLGCRLRASSALAVIDQFMRLHELTRGDLANEALRFRGRRGVIKLRRMIALASPLAESAGESWIRLAIIDAGLPDPQLQLVVVLEGREFRLDLAYEKHRVAIEYDGREFHATRSQQLADEARRELLRAHGWIVIVVTKMDLDRDSVRRWTAEIRAALYHRPLRPSWR
jgi:hypothetical protein